MKSIIYLWLTVIFLISNVIALPDDAGTSIDFTYETPINYSLIPTVNTSEYTNCWMTSEGIKCDVSDITYDEISGGDVNALGYTGFFNFLQGAVGQLSIDGDPWYLGGTDLEIDQDLQVDNLNVEHDIMPLNTLTGNIGSGALRWLNLFVQTINAESMELFNLNVTQNLTVDGFINGVNLSDLDGSFWTTSTSQTGLTGDKSGDYNLDTTGYGRFDSGVGVGITPGELGYQLVGYEMNGKSTEEKAFVRGFSSSLSNSDEIEETTLMNIRGYLGGTFPSDYLYHEYVTSTTTLIDDPTAQQIAMYLYWRIAGTDTNMKRWTIYNNADEVEAGKIFLGKDNIKTYFGTGYNTSLYYNGSSFIINPKEKGDSDVVINGNLTADYFIGDGSKLIGISSSGGNPFDQSLNTTDDVQFNNLNLTENITNPVNSTWGIYNDGECMIIGDLQYVSEC